MHYNTISSNSVYYKMMRLLRRTLNAFSCYSIPPPLEDNTQNTQNTQKKNDELDKITYSDTLPFVPPISHGKVIKVYDGDTITIASKLCDKMYRFPVRLNGIDTPEIKGKTATEKELAKKARDALSNIVMDKMVVLKNVSTEKYGRLLADVYIGDLCLNEWMLENKYAVKYDGGTKIIPDEWK